MKLPWFRMYVDFLNDPKIISLAFEDQRHFVGVLALKSDGVFDQKIDPDLLDRIVAQRLWIDHGVIQEVKKRLVKAGLIDSNWQPLAWDKRQMKSDGDSTAAERQRRSRAAKKVAREGEKGDVTDMSRVTVTNVTGLDTDSDTDLEKELPLSGGGFVDKFLKNAGVDATTASRAAKLASTASHEQLQIFEKIVNAGGLEKAKNKTAFVIHLAKCASKGELFPPEGEGEPPAPGGRVEEYHPPRGQAYIPDGEKMTQAGLLAGKALLAQARARAQI